MSISTPTLEQRRAKHAWAAIQDAKTLSENNQKKYGGEVKKLSVRIVSAGLGQAMCFLKAKGETEKLETSLSDWLLKQRLIGKKSDTDLLQAIISGDSEFLRRATDEALAYLQWLRRFADAEGLTKDEQD